MKTLTLGLLCLAQVAAASSVSVDGPACPPEGQAIVQVGKVAVWCVNGRERYAGHVGEVPIAITARLIKDDKPDTVIALQTPDGKPTAYMVGSKVGYPTMKDGAIVTDFVLDGFSLVVVPLLATNGEAIDVHVSAHLSKLVQLKPARASGIELQLPDVATLDVVQIVTGMEPGKDVAIPLGEAAGASYSLVLSAARLPL